MSTPTRYTATVRKNEHGEYVVRFSDNGKPMGEASKYYTDDKEDAKETMAACLASMNNG